MRLFVLLEEFQQVARTDFFFTFDQHFHVDRQRIPRLQVSRHGAQLSGNGALVIGGAAAKQPAVPARQRPGVGFPVVLRVADLVDRLHVVMGIQEDRRLAGAPSHSP